MSTGVGSGNKDMEMVKKLLEDARINLNIPFKPFETDLHEPGTLGLQLQDPPAYSDHQSGSASRQQVKNLIEQCIKHNQIENQVMDILYAQHKIEPSFTRRVWRELEEQNPRFFTLYYANHAVIDQITWHNDLVARQDELMKGQGIAVQSASSGVPTTSLEFDRQATGHRSSAPPSASNDQQSDSVP